jgi:hypothetical protein
MYFHSIYTRCPGGILVECAATAEGAFAKDEEYQKMGTSLLLPPWFEAQRKEIEAMLEPVTIPEANFAHALIEPKGAVGAVTTGSAGASHRSGDWVKS